MDPLITEDELASIIRETPAKTALFRGRYGWPSIKIGRRHKYTHAQVAEILRMQGIEPDRIALGPALIEGQSARSAARTA